MLLGNKVVPECVCSTKQYGLLASESVAKMLQSLMVRTPRETRSSAIAEGPRDASCQLKSCQLPRNCADTTYTTCPDQIDGMKLDI